MEEDYEQTYFKIEENFWWFKGRRDLVQQIVGPQTGKILEAGCGSGLNLLIFKDADRIGLDISEAAVKIGKEKGLNLVQADLNKGIPFPDDTFETVLALDIVEHLESEQDTLKEIHRVLKKEGKLILNVPACMSLWSYHDKVNMHKKRYKKEEVLKATKLAGFKKKTLSYWNSTLFPAVYLSVKLRNLTKNKESHLKEINPFVNKILFNILKIENKLIKKGVSLPFGVSVFYEGRK
jgi:SAM-dependent methyltransferase